MSSYHDSFTYKNRNSLKDMKLIIASFDPDNGFIDSFLSMESIYEDNAFGTRRFSYGAKYNSVATIDITVIKNDGTEFSMSEFRAIAQWITGARTDSWLDMYIDNEIVYSFLGKFIDLQPYRSDSRTAGLKLTFESVAPWAYSGPQTVDVNFGQQLYVNNDGYLYVNTVENSTLSVNKNGILFPNTSKDYGFEYLDPTVYDGVIWMQEIVDFEIDNPTDDLYTYINLDMKFTNKQSQYLSVINNYNSIDGYSVTEETRLSNVANNDIVLLSAEQFVVSEKYPQKVFGNDFNFVWPKLAPGINKFSISGSGEGNVQFTYRYPIKIGDGLIGTQISGNGLVCNNY